MNPILIALACGWGQQPMLDAYGNATCVQAQTGEVRRIEGRLSDCPTGTLPLLTERGPACVQKDLAQPYYDIRRECPNGTARALDDQGNGVCRVP
ncbi:MAG: hypothetical protein RLZZ09_2235 [Pseudomonadota bacterium]|jgi:hypothetical protein